jgi:hypothetical protein
MSHQSVTEYHRKARRASGNSPPSLLNRNRDWMILTKLSSSLFLISHSRWFGR